MIGRLPRSGAFTSGVAIGDAPALEFDESEESEESAALEFDKAEQAL